MKKLLLLPILICAHFPVFCQAYNAGTVFVNYQDFNPDTLLSYTVAPYTNETYGISLFGDLANSIEFTAHGAVSPGYSAAYIRVATVNPNIFFYYGRIDSVFTPTTNTWNITRIAMPLNAGDSINSMNALWDSTMVYLTDHTYSDGGNKDVNDWIGGHKYLGMKYTDGPYLAYGWVKLHCVSEDSCYLKEFSFSESNISVGIEEIAHNKRRVYPNPANTHFYLDDINMNSFSPFNIKLTDLYGKEIKFTTETDNNRIKIEPVEILSDGCYILQYLSENGVVISNKVMKITN